VEKKVGRNRGLKKPPFTHRVKLGRGPFGMPQNREEKLLKK